MMELATAPVDAPCDVVESEARVARAKIMRMQNACMSLPDGQRMDESPPLKHWFSDGVYCREISLPAGSVVVGRIHRHEHLNIISKGSCTVYTEFGTEELSAPATFVSKAGTKRIVYTHEDCIWTTIHKNEDNERDGSILEERYTSADYAELGMIVDQVELLSDKEIEL